MVRSSLLLRQLLHRTRQTNSSLTVGYGRNSNFCSPLTSTTFRSNTSVASLASSNVLFNTTLPSRSLLQVPTVFQARYFSTAGDNSESVVVDDLPRFSDLENLHPTTANLLASEGFETMTEIQARTWEVALSGKDVIGRARTGTGKTLAFLLPSLERVLQSKTEGELSILCISPTRELASQIGEQARMLTKAHQNASSAVVFGGVSKRQDIRTMQNRMPTILTATPGRLLDHLQTTTVGRTKFKDSVQGVQILILDEMDRLLDMGFRDDIERILAYMPKNRQTLLFSATVPKEVLAMTQKCTKSDSVTIDCMNEEDPATHTNARINQSHVILPAERVVCGVVQLVMRLMEEKNHKVLVFFPTTSQVAYYANLFNRGLGRRVLEIHSRKSQGNRTNTSDRFRQTKTGVMFTSDVSARGVDYPDVTHVVQFGVTSDRETYIHRLGRTGRAGKKGEGLLVLLDAEKGFLTRDLRDLDIPVDEVLQGLMNEPAPKHVDDELAPVLLGTRNGTMGELVKSAETVYRSLFGFYNGRLASLGVRSKDPIVDMANTFASQAGLQTIPTLSEKLAKQFGVTNHPGVNVRSGWSGKDGFDVGRGQGGNRGRGGDNRSRSSDRGQSNDRRSNSWDRGSSQRDPWGQEDSGSGRDGDWPSASASRGRSFSRPKRGR